MPRSIARQKSGPAHLVARVAALRERIVAARIDALLITNPRDIRYLTGFVGDDSWALVLAGDNRPTIISDFRFEEQIQRESPHSAMLIRKKGLADELSRIRKRRRLRLIGLQADHVTLAQHRVMKKKVGRGVFRAVDDGLIEQRSVKDAGEVEAIIRALRIQEEAFERVILRSKPGSTEVELASELEHVMRRLGADGPSFSTIVAADANGSLPHAIPGAKRTRAGGSLLIDWGARFGGYCGDLTRVIAYGRMPAKIREIYTITLEAQLAGIAAIAPGKKLSDIDAVARKIIKKAGYDKEFGHSLGHGIGLDIHEEPRLSGKVEGELQVGQVVTVEPGIYLPGVGGVRIEDDVLVTPTGGQVLSQLPKDVKSAII